MTLYKRSTIHSQNELKGLVTVGKWNNKQDSIQEKKTLDTS